MDRRNNEKDAEGKVEGDASGKKLKCVSLPPEAKPVMQELFTRYPPCDGDTTGTSLGIYTGHIGNKQKWRDDFFCKPQMKKEDFLNKATALSSGLANDKGFQEVSS